MLVRGTPPSAPNAQITTVAAPAVELGRLGMKTLQNRIRDGASTEPRRLIIRPHQTERVTTAPPPR